MEKHGEEGRGGSTPAAVDPVVDGRPPANKTPPPSSCIICMEPWIGNGEHRICCIPCGHMYGRSCLEKWLDHSHRIAAHRGIGGGAKCPQCGGKFERLQITNLYVPGMDTWSYCPSGEAGEYYKAEYDKLQKSFQSLMAHNAENKERIEFMELKMAVLNKLVALAKALIRKLEEQEILVKSYLETVKDNMKKMVTRDKATAMNIIEFMELSIAELPPDHHHPAC